MIESDVDPYIERIALAARRPVVIDPAAKARLMAAIRVEPMPVRQPSVWRWVVDRQVRLTPLGSFALAAGLVGIGVFLGVFARVNRDGVPSGGRQGAAVAQGQLSISDTVVKEVFVLVAPQAKHVSVVGDFNQWNMTATPLVRADGSGPWTVTLPLDAGRHVYSFVVDGRWTSDPSAPLAPDDGFGHANSVIMVSTGSAL
jgi:hypothetical protein